MRPDVYSANNPTLQTKPKAVLHGKMQKNLSDVVNSYVEQMFDPSDVEQAKKLLLQISETGGGNQAPGRCEIAALKRSDGKIEKLIQAVELYHTDYRDLLMSAGFGSDLNAHNTWQPDSQ